MNHLNAIVLVPGSMVGMPSFAERLEHAVKRKMLIPKEGACFVHIWMFKTEERRHAVCGVDLPLVEFVLDVCGLPKATGENEETAERVLSFYLRQVLRFVDRGLGVGDGTIFPMGMDGLFLTAAKEKTEQSDVYRLAFIQQHRALCFALKEVVHSDTAKIAAALKENLTDVPSSAQDAVCRALVLGTLTGFSSSDPKVHSSDAVAA